VTPRWTIPIVCALTFGMATSAYAETLQISMENMSIAPLDSSAKVGDTIEWVNRDIFVHTATARSGDWDILLPPKKTVTLVLTKAGKIEYFCRFHPNMKATLTVSPR
jgi:plastocyanin